MEETKKGFKLTNYIAIPTLLIIIFWVIVMIGGVLTNQELTTLLTDTIKRFGRWGILTLAMVPAIKSGTGPNFALPIGIVCGLLGVVCSFVLGFTGIGWFIAAVCLAIMFASLAGFGYGKLLNAVKGSEMTIATYTGFSATMLFCILWLILPFKDTRITWPLSAQSGLRQFIPLDVIGSAQVLDNFLAFRIFGIGIPTGMLLVFFFACFLVWLFTRSKIGIAVAAGGSNPIFATAAGLNVDRGRIIANIVSTVLGAVGIIVYGQSFGFSQLYTDPLLMAFPAVAAILIGGASVSKAKVTHVILGTLLFQGILTTTPPVANDLFPGTDLSETLRQIVQNGVILFALMQAGGRK